jgi:hypothetical protein
MQYQTQANLTTRIKNRLNDRTVVTFPWTTTEVCEAIQQAVEECFPLGHQAVVTMAKADYDANPQKISIDGGTSAAPSEPGLLHVRQIEVINTAGQPTLLVPGYQFTVSPHNAIFIRLFQAMGASESLRLDGVFGVAAPDGTTASDATVIKLDPTSVVLYSCAYLLRMNARQGGVSQRQDDQLQAEGFFAQAENRKAFLISQQYQGLTLPMQPAGGGGSASRR